MKRFYTKNSTCLQRYYHLNRHNLIVAKLFFSFAVLTSVVEVSDFIPLISLMYKDISIITFVICLLLTFTLTINLGG